MHSIRAISQSSANAQRFSGAAERRAAADKRRRQPSEASIYLSQFYGGPDQHGASTDLLSISGKRAETPQAAKSANGHANLQSAHPKAPFFAANQPKINPAAAQPTRFLKLTAEPSEALVQAQKLNEALQQRVRELQLQVSNLKSRGVFSRLFNLNK